MLANQILRGNVYLCKHLHRHRGAPVKKYKARVPGISCLLKRVKFTFSYSPLGRRIGVLQMRRQCRLVVDLRHGYSCRTGRGAVLQHQKKRTFVNVADRHKRPLVERDN